MGTINSCGRLCRSFCAAATALDRMHLLQLSRCLVHQLKGWSQSPGQFLVSWLVTPYMLVRMPAALTDLALFARC